MKRTIALLVTLPCFAALAAAQMPTELLTRSSAGAQANVGTSSFPMLGLSDDGRIVAFASGATNLVVGDVNGVADIFVRDRLLSTTELVSLSSAGVQANGPSEFPTASDDGRYVVFSSNANNLVAADGNGFYDIFLSDRSNGSTVRVSEASVGGDSNGSSYGGFISGDGRFVSFTSTATNLIASDTNGHADVFVRELSTGVTVLASVDSNGVQGSADSQTSRLSDDGSILIFASQANNLWPGDINQSIDVFVRDMITGTTEAASRTPAGVTPSHGAFTNPGLSGDGAFVAFESSSPDLGLPVNSGFEIFVFERATGSVQLVSRNFMGVPSGGSCAQPSLSDDGRYVTFHSLSKKLVNLDIGPLDDVFVVDRSNGEVTRASMNIFGYSAAGNSGSAKISGDGRTIVFCSIAPDLVQGDTNGVVDLFAHDRTQTQPVAYCESKVSGQGCTPYISSAGMPSLSQPSGFLIDGVAIKVDAPGLLIYATAPNKSPFLGGTLCLLPPIKRTLGQTAGGTTACTGRFSLDFNAWIAGHAGSFNAGDVVYAQYWYRDTLSSPYFAGLTDALRFVIYP
ncbi:MAG TPA: calcium-binding protein [Planctomycetota bacterium]|nr:calcium-binding protein [Planctomycetota bacterium]